MKVKVSDSLDNVPNENVVTTGDRQTDQPTNRQTDQLLELLEWLFATKNNLSETEGKLPTKSLILFLCTYRWGDSLVVCLETV